MQSITADIKIEIGGIKAARIDVIDLRPGDSLVLRYNQRQWAPGEARQLASSLGEVLQVPIAILPLEGVDLQTVRSGQPEQQAATCSLCVAPSVNGHAHPRARCNAHERGQAQLVE